MKNRKLKLLSALVVLVISVVMIVSGTYAWFTLNQAKTDVTGIEFVMTGTSKDWPFEFSLSEGGEYTKSVILSELFTKANLHEVTLNPISTYDGSKWYAASYDNAGNVKGLDEVRLEDIGTNISAYVSPESFRTNPSNCVVYFDVWVETKDDRATESHPYQLKLSNPISSEGIMDYEDEYGTFVVPVPFLNSNSVYEVSQASKDACCCIRIGFEPRSAVDGSAEGFVIYEPNADKRSSKFLENPAEGQVNYVYSESGEILVADHDHSGDYVDGQTYPTETMTSSGAIAVVPNVIMQHASYWKPETLNTLNSPFGDADNVHIGTFIDRDDTPAEYSGIDTLPIMELYCDEDGNPVPKILRVYIWLEGQDIDCWNKISLGSIYSHLEFRGDYVD